MAIDLPDRPDDAWRTKVLWLTEPADLQGLPVQRFVAALLDDPDKASKPVGRALAFRLARGTGHDRAVATIAVAAAPLLEPDQIARVLADDGALADVRLDFTTPDIASLRRQLTRVLEGYPSPLRTDLVLSLIDDHVHAVYQDVPARRRDAAMYLAATRAEAARVQPRDSHAFLETARAALQRQDLDAAGVEETARLVSRVLRTARRGDPNGLDPIDAFTDDEAPLLRLAHDHVNASAETRQWTERGLERADAADADAARARAAGDEQYQATLDRRALDGRRAARLSGRALDARLVTGDEFVRAAIAERSINLTTEQRDSLRTDPNYRVRQGFATRDDLAPDEVESLIHTGELDVLATNARVQVQALTAAAGSRRPDHRHVAAVADRTPDDVVETLTNDPDLRVARAASITLGVRGVAHLPASPAPAIVAVQRAALAVGVRRATLPDPRSTRAWADIDSMLDDLPFAGLPTNAAALDGQTMDGPRDSFAIAVVGRPSELAQNAVEMRNCTLDLRDDLEEGTRVLLRATRESDRAVFNVSLIRDSYTKAWTVDEINARRNDERRVPMSLTAVADRLAAQVQLGNDVGRSAGTRGPAGPGIGRGLGA